MKRIRKRQANKEEELEKMVKDAFLIFDSNNDGVLDKDEIRKTMASMGEHLSEEEARYLILRGDVTKSGTLNFDEFLRLVKILRDEETDKETKLFY